MSYFNIIDECILRYKDNVDKINDKGFEAESCSDLNGYLIKEIEEKCSYNNEIYYENKKIIESLEGRPMY